MFATLLALIYLCFISLGLPDALLGSAWPTMVGALRVPLSASGILFMIIALGTVVSSLLSERLICRWGAGRVTACSVGLTSIALLGFSLSSRFAQLCFWAIPYGLGAGSVDAALNNYVALHFASRHMSWLHCMWGVGALTGPMVMGAVLSRSQPWTMGYRIIALLQAAITLVLLLTLPLWRTRAEASEMHEPPHPPLRLRETLSIPGALSVMLCFFCYCALEQTVGLWASSWLVAHRGIDTVGAARFGGFFFIGITAGRGLCGFISYVLCDRQMVRLGAALLGLGIALLLFPGRIALAGLILIGAGCAPVYPSLIHATPAHFGAARSQAMIGLQMAAAYVGTAIMPPAFGLLSQILSLRLFPLMLLLLLLVMVFMHECLERQTRKIP